MMLCVMCHVMCYAICGKGLLEYLLFAFSRPVADCLNNPQGGGPEEKKKLDDAQAKLEEVSCLLCLC